MTNTRNANGWSDAQAVVGEVIGRTVGTDLVTLGDIRRKLEVVALDCPLHYDESCARAFGYRTVVGPVSMTRVWAIAPSWIPGQPRPGHEPLRTMLSSADPPGHGDTVIAARLAAEHHEPVCPGDRVTGTAVLRRLTPKTTRVGAGVFIEVETTFVNQHEQLVTVELATVFRFDRSHDSREAPALQAAAAPPTDAPPANGRGFGHVDGVLHHEDVSAGEPLPAIGLPITLQRLAMEAGANRDFSVAFRPRRRTLTRRSHRISQYDPDRDAARGRRRTVGTARGQDRAPGVRNARSDVCRRRRSDQRASRRESGRRER
jgi:acyl dehydratase